MDHPLEDHTSMTDQSKADAETLLSAADTIKDEAKRSQITHILNRQYRTESNMLRYTHVYASYEGLIVCQIGLLFKHKVFRY